MWEACGGADSRGVKFTRCSNFNFFSTTFYNFPSTTFYGTFTFLASSLDLTWNFFWEFYDTLIFVTPLLRHFVFLLQVCSHNEISNGQFALHAGVSIRRPNQTKTFEEAKIFRPYVSNLMHKKEKNIVCSSGY